MDHRLTVVVSILVLSLAAPWAMASAAPVKTAAVASTVSAKPGTTPAQAAKLDKKLKRIAHIQAHISRLERLKAILLSKSETLRLAKAARVGSQIRKLQTKLAGLKG